MSTPGPWKVEPLAQQQPRVPLKTAHAVILDVEGRRLADVRLAVDAAKMAASPEMYEALIALRKAVLDRNYFAVENAFTMEGFAYAALAKAEGKS